MTGGAGGVPGLAALYAGFFRAGARGFGGVLPWARRMLVEERGWLTATEFTELFGLCQFLPGPNVVNLATAVGTRFHGARGAVAALAGLLSMPIAAILTLATLYARFGQAPGVAPVLRGVGAAAAGLLLATGLKMAGPLARSPRAVAVMVAAFAGIALLRVPLVPLLLVLAPLSIAAARLARGFRGGPA